MPRRNVSQRYRIVSTQAAGKSTVYLVSKQLGDKGMQEVAVAVQEAGTVETITLDYSNIGTLIGVSNLANTLRPPTVLSKLSVDNCKLGDAGIGRLCSTLALNNVLRELSLCGNSIGEKGAKKLAGVLFSNSAVETLLLASNKLGDDGIKYLADALRRSRTTALQNLQLSRNDVSDEGAKKLAQCLKSNKVLRVLELWKNQIKCVGAHALAASIKEHNKALEKLNLNANRIGVSGVAELTNVQLANSTLASLHLEGNPGLPRQQRPTRVVIGANENTLTLSGRTLRGHANANNLSVGETREEPAVGKRNAQYVYPSDDVVWEPRENESEEEPQAPSLAYIPLGNPRFLPYINTQAGHSVGEIYDFRNDIARGSFGTVFNAVNHRTHRAVAIKVGKPTILDHNDAYQDNNSIRDVTSMYKYCQEIKSLMRLRDSPSSLLHMEEFFVENGSFYIVSEPMEISLGQWKASVSHFSEDMAREIARSLIAALDYMDEQHVIHRDIKPSNILFRHKGDISSLKIIDFGLSRSLKSDHERRFTFVGSLGYIAPEIYKRQGYRVEVDMFSFGVVLFRLLSGKRPFSSSSRTDLALSVMGNRYTMDDDSWSVVSHEAKEFVRGLIIQRDKRLTVESASLHPWFHTRPQHSNLLPESGSKLGSYDDSDQEDSKLRSALVSIIRAGRDALGALGLLDDHLAKALTVDDKNKSAYGRYVGDPAGRRLEPPGNYQPMPEKQKWVGSVFVSHTSTDPDKAGSTFASHLCDSFCDEGIDPFFDAWSIHGGDDVKKKLLEGIDACTVFVCVLTPNYFYRYWCMKELDRAFRSEKIIIPVYLQVEPPNVNDELFLRKFSDAHIEKLQMDHQVIARWLLNIRNLKDIQAVRNYSQPKDYQVEMKKKTVEAVKKKLGKEPA